MRFDTAQCNIFFVDNILKNVIVKLTRKNFNKTVNIENILLFEFGDW